MESIREIIREKNITLDTLDPVAREGFTQVPNFIIRNPSLSMGARLAYSVLLSYAWHNDFCFPGQDRMAIDMGISRASVTAFIGELQKAGYLTVQRRGQGLTNHYTLHFKVQSKHPEVSGLTSRGQRGNIKKSVC